MTDLETTPSTESIWPPPPAIASLVASPDNRLRWFRPALWLGLAFNLMALMPALGLLQVPNSKEEVSLSLMSYPQTGVIFAAALALFCGAPFAVWQLKERQRRGQSLVWEVAGLLLCLLPLPLGLKVTSIIVMAKGFHTAGM